MILNDFLNLQFKSKHKIVYMLNGKVTTYYDLRHLNSTEEIEKIIFDIVQTDLDDSDIGINSTDNIYNTETNYTIELPCSCFYYNIVINIITKERR